MKKLVLSISITLTTSLCFSQGILDNYLTDQLTYVEVGSSTEGLIQPQDLDFKANSDELWVMNKVTNNSMQGNFNTTGGSFIVFYDAGLTGQTSEYRKDSHAGHFMMNASAVAFGDNGFFATSQDIQNTNPNSPIFMGPSLWSQDTAEFARLWQSNWAQNQPLGSHYDMLHESPNGKGIAHETNNVYWISSAYNGDISRYDFGADHDAGGEYHGDGIIHRYTDVPFTEASNNIPSHMVIDKANNYLYYIDGGGQRVIRLDITTGTLGNTLPSQDGLGNNYREKTGATWVDYINTGLTQPCGIEYYQDRLLVSDYSNGDIHMYDVSSGTASFLGTIQTGAAGIMGIKVGPSGRIWYINRLQQKVYRIDNEQFPVSVNQLAMQKASKIFPNPSNGIFTIETPVGDKFNVTIFNSTGQVVSSQVNNSNRIIVNERLAKGMYFIEVKGESTQYYYSDKIMVN